MLRIPCCCSFKHLLVLSCGIVVCLIGVVTQATSQCDSTFQAIGEGYGWALALEDGSIDTANIHSLDDHGPEYVFYSASDSSKLRFQFGEFMANRRKVFLANWCFGRTVNWSDSLDAPTHEWTPQQMRDRSYVRDFPVNPGDTLQFYRAVWWEDRLNSAVIASRYINPDPVSYSVSVEYANGTRMAVIDTMYFGTTTSDRRPCIVTWYPMLSRVRYLIPSTTDSNTTVRIRFSMYHHGSPPQPFVRNDVYDGWESAQHLGSQDWRAWNDSVVAVNNCASQQSCDISVTSGTSPSRVNITVASPSDIDRVDIVTVNGTTVWTSSVPMASNPMPVNVNTGLYIVVAKKNGSVQCTRKVIVQ